MISKSVSGQANRHSEAWRDLLSGGGEGSGGEIKSSRCFHRQAACLLQIADRLLSFRRLSHNLSGPRMSGIVNIKEVSASHFHCQALFIAD